MADARIVFTPSEVEAMQKWPEALRALADWHDYQETQAAAMDNEVFAPQIKHHRERRKELTAEADRIEIAAIEGENAALGVGELAGLPAEIDRTAGVAPCRAERRANGQGWSCDCFHMRPDCKPTLPDGVRVDAPWSRTVGDALELSGLAPYIKDGDLAHLHAALRFVELMRTPGVTVRSGEVKTQETLTGGGQLKQTK